MRAVGDPGTGGARIEARAGVVGHRVAALARWFGRPLNLLAIFAALVFTLLAAEALVGGASVGVTVDEPAHVARFDGWLDSGYYMSDALLVGGEPDPANPLATPYVYGAAFSSAAHLVSVAVGMESLGETSGTAGAYSARGVVVALLGILAAIGVALAVRAITRDRLAALFAAAALLAIPAWTGRAMWDIKDIPAGAGYTLLTAGLVIAVACGRDAPSVRRQIGAGALVGTGVFFGAGTRLGLWAPLVVSLILFVTLSAVLLARSGRIARPPLGPVVGFAAGLILVAALHPKLASSPASFLRGSVSDSAGYDQPSSSLVFGFDIDAMNAPSWYLPLLLFGGVPLLLFALALLGVASWGRRSLSLRKRIGAHGPEECRTAAVALVLTQLALVPFAASQSENAGSIQHHLYVFPAAAILAGLGAHRLLVRLRQRHSPAWRWAIVSGLGLALLVPTVEQTRLYPYNYVYVNPLAGVRGYDGYWEPEGAWASSREAIRQVPADATLACSFNLVPEFGSHADVDLFDCGAQLRPYRDEVGSDARGVSAPGEIWIVGRNRGLNQPPTYCDDAGSVTRPLRGEELVMSYVLRCNPPPEVLESLSPQITGAPAEAGFSLFAATGEREDSVRAGMYQ